MKLIDEKEKLFFEKIENDISLYGIKQVYAEIFNEGYNKSEQQLKQKMIEAIDWAFKNYHSFDGIIVPINTNDILKFKTTEQLLEEFINKDK